MGEKIIEQFNAGKKMVDISRDLNVPYNTVKSIIRRMHETEKKVEVEVKVTPEDECLCCGKKITSVEGKKKKRFCSSNCRVKYWRMKNAKV